MATHFGKGDLLVPLEITLTQNGTVFPLIGGDTLSLRWSIGDPANPGTTRVQVVPIVVNPPGTDGKIKHDFTAGQTDVVETYFGQVTVTRGGKQISFPDDGSWYIWSVNAKI